MTRAALSVVPLILAACVGNDGGDRLDRPGLVDAGCDANPAARFIGTPFQPSVAEQAMRLARARTVRVIRPGQAVTMDFRSDRLNLEIDEQGRIGAVRCG